MHWKQRYYKKNLIGIDALSLVLSLFTAIYIKHQAFIFPSSFIDFLFLGTHSPNRQFINKLESYGYKIICSFEVQESFFDDGLILACSESIYNNLDLNKFTVSKKR